MNTYKNCLKNKCVLFAMLLVLINSSVCYAQYSIDVSMADLLIYNTSDADIRFFKEKTKNQYVEFYLELEDSSENNFISTEIEYEDASKKLNEIKMYKDDVLLFKKDLKEINTKELVNTEKEIVENWYKEGDAKNKLVLKFLNKSIAGLQEIYFGKKKFNGSFGSFTVKRANDSIKKWRVYYAEYYTTIALNLGNNKKLYLLTEGDDIEHVFLPLKTANYLISDDDGISKLQSTSAYKMSYLEDFQPFDFDDFMSIYKKENGYTLVNSFKKDLLTATYDTIIYNQFFSIGKNKDKIDIYNSYYQKLPFKNIKSAYLIRSGLEVLDEKGARYYNSELKSIAKFPLGVYTVCGTVNETRYSLEYDKDLKINTLLKTNGGYVSNIDEKRKYYLATIKRNDRVTFLDNSVGYYWDENDGYVGTNYRYPELLKITRANKRGIFEYDYTDTTVATDTILKDWKKEVSYAPATIKGKMILPINNDSIVFSNKDGLIYFYRKNKVGIFPRHKKVQYKAIEKVTNSFYKIDRKNKRGWLDIQSNIEYFE